MQEIEITGTVHAIHYSNPETNWMAGKIRLAKPVDGKRVMGFSGKVMPT